MAKKNEVVLTFGGDATALEKASQKATASTDKTEKGFGKLASGAAFLTAGLVNIGDTLGQVADISRIGQERADRLARAQADVSQATLDLDQAQRDLKQSTLDIEQAQRDLAQSGLDVEQAQIDAEVAQSDYNAAVKEFGANSVEARQAGVDLKQATEDLNQAQLDAKQAAEDQTQAIEDGKQAQQDATTAALDLKDAQREASDSGGWRSWLDTVSGFAPLLLTVVGAMQLLNFAKLTDIATQIAVNVATYAWPIVWIIAGIVALVAIIVLLVKNWDWVKDVAGKAWDWIKDKAVDFWNWLEKLPGKIGNAFSGLAGIVTGAFKSALNGAIGIVNSAIGFINSKLIDTANLVPFVNIPHIPSIPKLHSGGIVPGRFGEEVLTVLQAGERVESRRSVATDPGGEGGGGDTYTFNLTVDPTKFKTIEDFLAWADNLKNNRRRGVA